MGCIEFDFKVNGVEVLPRVTSIDGNPTKVECVKI